MKKFLCLVLLILSASCAATLVSTPQDGVHVIGYKTGSLAMGWYDKKFMERAEETCAGQSFQVLEKSVKPEILKCAGELVDRYDFYWVVKCQ